MLSKTRAPRPRSRRAPLRRHLPALLLGLGAIAATSCAEFDTNRTPPKRGSVGEEIYGMLCDRVGAQALREDLTGDSYRDVCHRPRDGEYATEVDTKRLPKLSESARDASGKLVPMEVQEAQRIRAIARIEAMGRRRADLIRALDATFPEEIIAIKDLSNPDPKKTCDPPAKSGEGTLTRELADMLGRMTDLYNDGTIPNSTRSLGAVLRAFQEDGEAIAAWQRLAGRRGYRPLKTALGAARPSLAYPRLRDLANATLSLLSEDSKPYQIDPRRDADGNRIPVPGPAHPQFSKMLEVARAELLTAAADPPLAPLRASQDAQTGRILLNRPRTTLEITEAVLLAENEAFGGGAPRFIVRRDSRGYAMIRGSQLPSPFVDQNGDGLPDVDAFGRFKTTNGSLAPTPFPVVGGAEFARDEFGRAKVGASDFLYEYVDTSHTFAAQLLQDTKPLLNPSPEAKHETLMDALAGLYVVAGARDGAESSAADYGDGLVVRYDAFHAEQSPLLDALYAGAVLLGDRTMDPTLALVRRLLDEKSQEVARLTGAMLTAREMANAHPEAKIPPTATLWDEILDVVAKIAQHPGLLEDVLLATADPQTERLGTVFAEFAKHRDVLTYDRDDVNGAYVNVTVRQKGAEPRTPVDRARPGTGDNRSALHRFLTLIGDANGVTACNKPNAKVHGKLGPLTVDIPVGSGTFRECEVFMIPNLASFYIDALANVPTTPNDPFKGRFYIRDGFMRNGVGGLGAASVGLMEDSSNLTGFWTDRGSTDLAAKPEWLNRLVFFDLKNDSPNEGDKNYVTNRFIRDMSGEKLGSGVCPVRVIDDPCASKDCGNPQGAKVAPDGKVRLRDCDEGDWLQDRAGDSIFLGESMGLYAALTPLVRAFAKHDREDLFLEFAQAAGKHWADAGASAAECKTGPGTMCPRTGVVTYEPLLGEVLATDVLPALAELTRQLNVLRVPRCDATDASGVCTKSSTPTGIQVLAEATRAAVDPEYAKKVLKLKDRRGDSKGYRNDGTTNPQVTPAYLLTQALNAMDEAFVLHEKAHPTDKGRLALWRRARSQLTDQFLAVDGKGAKAQFRSPALPKIGVQIVDVLRAQLFARCPRSFSPPYERCDWAADTLTKNAAESLRGPTFGAALDLVDAVRRDEAGRRELEAMMQYLLDAASEGDAFASVLASMSDGIQAMRDDKNLVPFFRVLAVALEPSTYDRKGKVENRGLVDAQMALLAKASGKYFDEDGTEICAREIDPNQILTRALRHAVTPMEDGQTPLEVLIDTVAEVNRADATDTSPAYSSDDYKAISESVSDFLLNKERGLEQFYEIVRRGTIDL